MPPIDAYLNTSEYLRLWIGNILVILFDDIICKFCFPLVYNPGQNFLRSYVLCRSATCEASHIQCLLY